MAEYASEVTSISWKLFLKTVFLISLFFFFLFAYLLYNYHVVLLSPSNVMSNGVGEFLFWVLIIGLIVTLIIIAFVLYFFFHESEHRHVFTNLRKI